MDHVGRYKILRPLGKGGMGVVYLAEDPLLNRRVAIKTLDLSDNESSDKEFLRASLLRDARAAAGLVHTNIVAVYDVIEEGDCAYLVLEYVPGQTLAQRLSAGPKAGTEFVLRVLQQVASALDYTHARGIVHRDIKPANVLLDAQDSAKITDFGIARMNDGRTRTATGTMIGTIDYMAPEQVSGGAADGRADQAALAAVAYEMLTGRTPYGDLPLTTLVYKIVHEMPPPARTHNPSLPAGVDDVLSRALSKLPAGRYATCGEFVAALTRALAPSGASGALTEPMVRSKGKGRVRWPLAAAAGVLLTAGAALVLWKPHTPIRVEAPAPTIPDPSPELPPAVPPKKAAAGVPSSANTESAKPVRNASDPAPRPTAGPPPASTTPVTPVDSNTATAPVAPKLPPRAAAAYNEGLKLLRSGRPQDALDAFSRAIQLKPDNSMAYAGRASALTRLGRSDEALRDINEALRLNPRDAMALSARGNYYASKGQPDVAISDYTASIAISPTSMAYNNRGRIYLDRKEYAKARSDFTSAIEMRPDFLLAYRSRRLIEIATGDTAGAEADGRKIRSLESRK